MKMWVKQLFLLLLELYSGLNLHLIREFEVSDEEETERDEKRGENISSYIVRMASRSLVSSTLWSPGR